MPLRPHYQYTALTPQVNLLLGHEAQMIRSTIRPSILLTGSASEQLPDVSLSGVARYVTEEYGYIGMSALAFIGLSVAMYFVTGPTTTMLVTGIGSIASLVLGVVLLIKARQELDALGEAVRSVSAVVPMITMLLYLFCIYLLAFPVVVTLYKNGFTWGYGTIGVLLALFGLNMMRHARNIQETWWTLKLDLKRNGIQDVQP